MDKTGYEMFIEWTATNMFIVPTLGIERKNLNSIGLINAYIDDSIKQSEYKGVIYLLFNPPDLEKFEDFLEEERKKKKIIDEYNYGRMVMVVFQYPSEFEKDVILIQEGKFSEVSEKLKGTIKKTFIASTLTKKEELTIQHQIFNKTRQIMDFWGDKFGLNFHKDDEVWPFYSEKEIFNNKIYENITKIHTGITGLRVG